MATETLNCVGLRCPQPVLKLAAKAPDVKKGDIIEVVADCPTFEKDIKAWCSRMKKTLLSVVDDGGGKQRAQIQF